MAGPHLPGQALHCGPFQKGPNPGPVARLGLKTGGASSETIYLQAKEPSATRSLSKAALHLLSGLGQSK